jgi:HD-GYP domain-containing protein (c-di-GMP phosphodiesterase class II)
MKEEEAIDRLKRASGEQFDSRIVDVFLQNQIYLLHDNNFKVEIVNKIQVGRK